MFYQNIQTNVIEGSFERDANLHYKMLQTTGTSKFRLYNRHGGTIEQRQSYERIIILITQAETIIYGFYHSCPLTVYNVYNLYRPEIKPWTSLDITMNLRPRFFQEDTSGHRTVRHMQNATFFYPKNPVFCFINC